MLENFLIGREFSVSQHFCGIIVFIYMLCMTHSLLHTSEEEQNMMFQNMSLWQKHFFDLIILRNSINGRSFKNSRSYPSARNIYIYKENLCLCLPLFTKKGILL